MYGLPFGLTTAFQRKVGDPLRSALSGACGPLLPAWRRAKRGAAAAATCGHVIGPIHVETDLTVCLRLKQGTLCSFATWTVESTAAAAHER